MRRAAMPLVRAAAVLAGALWLTACGGGGAGADGQATALAAEATVTIPRFMALRAQTTAVPGGAVPDASTLATLAAANRVQATADLARLTTLGGNGLVAPPLTAQALRTLGAAAAGDSLAELAPLITPPPSDYLAAWQTGRIGSLVWGQTGAGFSPAFLNAVDRLGPFNRLAPWSAFGELDFAAGTAFSDASLVASLASFGSSAALAPALLAQPTRTRLLVHNTLRSSVPWNGATRVDALFGRGDSRVLRAPMWRITQGVQQVSGGDFSAQVLTGAELRLVVLQPASASLNTYAGSRLPAALGEVLAALDTGSVRTGGTLLVPAMDIQIATDHDAPLRRQGVQLVFDERLANLRGLDTVGGTYAQSVSPLAWLHSDATSLVLDTSHLLAMTFSPNNVNGTSGAAAGSTLVNLGPICFGAPKPDLQPFFLVVLDLQGAVQAMAAIEALPDGPGVSLACGS